MCEVQRTLFVIHIDGVHFFSFVFLLYSLALLPVQPQKENNDSILVPPCFYDAVVLKLILSIPAKVCHIF